MGGICLAALCMILGATVGAAAPRVRRKVGEGRGAGWKMFSGFLVSGFQGLRVFLLQGLANTSLFGF